MTIRSTSHAFLAAMLASASLLGCSGSGPSPAGRPSPESAAREGGGPSDGTVYYAYVGAESADLIHRIRFGPDGVAVEKTTAVGEMAVETEGPHGLMVSPDGRHLYMTTAHGIPDGKLWKLDPGPDTLVAPPILLGNFPATLDLTPDGLYAFVVNFNLHGEHVPSTVSVVYTPDLVEVDQITTCTMPHGLRMAPDGLFAYSACMMDDQLVEIDTRTFEVSRRFSVAVDHEGAVHDYVVRESPTGALGLGPGGVRAMPERAHEPSCSPTWAQPSPDGTRVYVACNKADRILVVDRRSWALESKWEAGRAPYNLGVTADGELLIATLKGAGQVQFFDTGSGESLGVVPSSTTVTHGVAVTPDGRYAFVSVEGVGAEPGKVDVYDLGSFERVGSVEVGQQAGGIVFWRMERAAGG